ncbi:hypothetical protein D3C85_1602820 [compost metagenome]
MCGSVDLFARAGTPARRSLRCPVIPLTCPWPELVPESAARVVRAASLARPGRQGSRRAWRCPADVPAVFPRVLQQAAALRHARRTCRPGPT